MDPPHVSVRCRTSRLRLIPTSTSIDGTNPVRTISKQPPNCELRFTVVILFSGTVLRG